jgi:hypothetical protein
MPETEYVKIVFDGQEYWLLWRWNKLLTPTDLKYSYTYASGPFDSIAQAEQMVTPGWTLEPYRS